MCAHLRTLACSVATRHAHTCAPTAQHCDTTGVHVRTDRAALRHHRCARAHPTRSIATPQVCTCAPRAQRCHTAGVHVRTDRSIATPQVRTCAPTAQHCDTAGVHGCTDRAALPRPRCAPAHRARSVATPQVYTCAPRAQRCDTAVSTVAHLPGTPAAAAGKWIYEYRIDMTQVAGITYARNPVRDDHACATSTSRVQVEFECGVTLI